MDLLKIKPHMSNYQVMSWKEKVIKNVNRLDIYDLLYLKQCAKSPIIKYCSKKLRILSPIMLLTILPTSDVKLINWTVNPNHISVTFLFFLFG